MFQTFSQASDPSQSAPRIEALRRLLAERGLAAFLVPRGDEHQGEYVAPSSERLRWLTGFSGSAGVAIVARKHAAVIVDGRYTVQVRSECDAKLFEFPAFGRTAQSDWIAAKLKRGDVVGFDPWLHTVSEIERLGDALRDAGITMKPQPRNLVDQVWGRERPSPPHGAVSVHPLKYAGRAADLKIAALQDLLKSQKQDAVVLTSPDSIAWLFNIRGRDVAHNPVALAFAIVPHSGKPELYIAPEKIGAEAKQYLSSIVKLQKPEALKARLAALKAAKKTVRVDPDRASYVFARGLGRSLVRGADPVVRLKAIKNAQEVKGARAAHVRDGAAVVRFLSWLDETAASGKLDEIAVVKALEAERAKTGLLADISFDTISGSGPNGAIVHYRVSEATNRHLKAGELFLIDSGAQYLDGTTDITRTVAIGKPTSEMRDRFTRVLKGHIAIASARFPKGTRGLDLDPFARRALWEAGLDYDHGTGHGVGSYLSVHEGPQSISKAGMVALEPGMIISNEPGYYKEGHYGIRIENLILVELLEIPEGGERPMMGFETLTLAPIDRRLIEVGLLTTDERHWINGYHERVRRELAPLVEGSVRDWLTSATEAV